MDEKDIEKKKEKIKKGLRMSKFPKGTTIIVSMKVSEDKNELVHAEVSE